MNDCTRLPRALAEDYAFVSCLRNLPDRRTLLVQERSTGRKAILKSDAVPDRLHNEYALCRELAGDGVPRCCALFEEDGLCHLLREYIPGRTLTEHIALNGPLPPQEAVRLIQSLLDILKRFHSAEPPVIHRDITPDNLVLTPEGALCLIDLGISRRFQDSQARDTQVLGTPLSAPPEQYGFAQTDARSDVYAVGVLLRFLLTGDMQPVSPVEDAHLDTVISRCCAFSPEKRYADASALSAALDRAMRRPFRVRHSCRMRIGLAMLAILLLTAGVFMAVSHARGFREPLIEQAIREQLGKPKGALSDEELAQITALAIVDDQIVPSLSQVSTDGGTLLVDGQPCMKSGSIRSLDDLRRLPNLRTLLLAGQAITDIRALAGLPIERLYLFGNRITDLSPLSGCDALLLLNIAQNPVDDLSPLASCPSMTLLDVSGTSIRSLDGLDGCTMLADLRAFECAELDRIDALTRTPLAALSLRPCSPAQLSVIAGMTSLRHLYLWQPQGLTTLEPLCSLSGLQTLFIDSPLLVSLDGLEALGALEELRLLNAPLTDLGPLASADSVYALELINIHPDSLRPLEEMRSLQRLTCSSDLREAVMALSIDGKLTFVD